MSHLEKGLAAHIVTNIEKFFRRTDIYLDKVIETTFRTSTEAIGSIFPKMDLLPGHWETLDPLEKLQYKLAKFSAQLNVAKMTRVLINHPDVSILGDQFIDKIFRNFQPSNDQYFPSWLYSQLALLHRAEAVKFNLLDNTHYYAEIFRLLRKAGFTQPQLSDTTANFLNHPRPYGRGVM